MKYIYTILLLCLFLSIQTYTQVVNKGEFLSKAHNNEKLKSAIKTNVNTIAENIETRLMLQESRITVDKSVLSNGFLLEEMREEVWDGSKWVDNYIYSYTYNADNNLIEEIWQTWTGSVWLNEYKYIYVYDQNKKLSELYWQKWNHPSWINIERAVHSYNARDKIIELTHQRWESSNWINEFKYTYIYDLNDNLLEEYYKIWNENLTDWYNDNVLKCTYDMNNRLVEELYQEWDETVFINSRKHLFSYNNIDSLDTRTGQVWDGQKWTNTWRWKKEYLTNNYLFEWWDEEWDGQKWVSAGDKITYYYDANNNLIEEIFQEWNGSDWANKWRHLRTYDVYNNLIAWWDQIWDGSKWVDDGGKIKYLYDHNNNLIQRIWQKWNGIDWINYNKYIYSYKLATSIDDFTELMPIFSLSQNYPNPFNPSTTIKWQMPETGFVTIKIYDVLGREVATLVNKQQIPGSYAVEWNANNQSSGIYFYRIRAGEFVETKKMILLR